MADDRIRVTEPASGEDEGRNCPFYPSFKAGFRTTDLFCNYKHI